MFITQAWSKISEEKYLRAENVAFKCSCRSCNDPTSFTYKQKKNYLSFAIECNRLAARNATEKWTCNFLCGSVKEMWKMWCRNGKFASRLNISEHDFEASQWQVLKISWKAELPGKHWRNIHRPQLHIDQLKIEISIETSFAACSLSCLETCSSVKRTWKFKV